MDKFLVTGGAGFIGSNICRKLVSQDCFVRVIDNLLTGKKSNLSAIFDKIEFIEADMGDPDVARQAMKGIDVVLHQGALPSVPKSIDNPAATHKHCLDLRQGRRVPVSRRTGGVNETPHLRVSGCQK